MKRPLGNIMKQAQAMQEKLKEAQQELATIEVTGAAGGGLVEVVMTCRYDVRRLSIDDSLVGDDKEVLEDVTDGTLLKARGDERKIDVKSALPVAATTDTAAERTARPGAMDKRRKAKTEDLISFLNNYLDVGETRALTSAGRWLRAQMEYGLYDKTLKSVNRNLAGVLELWSRKFELKERGRNSYVKRLR